MNKFFIQHIDGSSETVAATVKTVNSTVKEIAGDLFFLAGSCRSRT